jgi:hypothetical protein
MITYRLDVSLEKHMNKVLVSGTDSEPRQLGPKHAKDNMRKTSTMPSSIQTVRLYVFFSGKQRHRRWYSERMMRLYVFFQGSRGIGGGIPIEGSE